MSVFKFTVRSFQVTEAYSWFGRIRALYRTLRPSKEEKWLRTNERALEGVVPDKIRNFTDENAVYFQA